MEINTNVQILQDNSRVYNYSNESSLIINDIYDYLSTHISCTYIIYMYENLFTNEKSIYTSNWDWQDYLIRQKLINSCPVFLAAFRYLESKNEGEIFLPWNHALPRNKAERNVCGVRADLNIANGFGYGAKGHGVRETLAFGGDKKDTDFHKNFLANPNLLPSILLQMRKTLLTKESDGKSISTITTQIQ